MRSLTVSECDLVVGGSRLNQGAWTTVYLVQDESERSGQGQDGSTEGNGGRQSTNPMEDGSGSQTDEAFQNFRDGNVFTGSYQVIFGSPEILMNGLDGAVRYLGDAIENFMSKDEPPTAKELGLRPAIPQ